MIRSKLITVFADIQEKGIPFLAVESPKYKSKTFQLLFPILLDLANTKWKYDKLLLGREVFQRFQVYSKNWITSGGSSKIHLVIAQTDVEKKHRGINAFIVETDWEGVEIGAKEDKLGIRSSDTHTIMYNDVKVPKENRIGEDGFGFKFAMKVLSGGRIGIASQALGIAAGAFELATAYSKERKSFGKEIYQHQVIAFKLADMATDIEAARLMVHRAAWMKDNGLDYTISASMAKLFASDAAMKHTVEAVQVHGGYGFVKEYHVERLMRDAKITQIYEGTSEIQKLVIARGIINGELYVPLNVV